MAGYKSGVNRSQIMMNSLESMVAPESMARVIDYFIEVVDLKKLGFIKCQPAETGRPAYPPKAMCKLYVYGYENGIRSSRKLEHETIRNIEVMWLMDSLTPDYKTISEFRREDARSLQKLFREFVKLCKSWELVGGELIAVDGTKIKESNNKKRKRKAPTIARTPIKLIILLSFNSCLSAKTCTRATKNSLMKAAQQSYPLLTLTHGSWAIIEAA